MEPIAIIGDIHLNPKCENATILNKILQAQQQFFTDLVADLSARGITKAVFTGDIFTNHRYVSVEAINDAINLFGKTLKDAGIEAYVIAGNHDFLYEDVPSISSVGMLSLFPNVHLFIDKVGKVKIDDRNWYFVPWVFQEKMEKMNEWLSGLAAKGKTDKNVIVGHFDMYGALMEAGQRSEAGFDVNKFYNAAKHTFSGHYHCRSDMRPSPDSETHITYVGTPYHLSFAHVGTECGYYIIDGDKVEFIENTKAPRFIDIVDSDIGDEMPDLSNNFVRYFTRNDRTHDEAMVLRMKLEHAAPLLIKTVPYGNTPDEDIDVQRIADDEETRRILSSDSLGMADLYMEKNPELLPELHSGEDPKQKIRDFLLEMTEKRT